MAGIVHQNDHHAAVIPGEKTVWCYLALILELPFYSFQLGFFNIITAYGTLASRVAN